MSSNKKLITIITAIALSILVLSGCSIIQNSKSAAQDNSSVSETQDSDLFTERDLNPSYDEGNAIKITLSEDSSECSSSDVEISGNTITIKNEGVYILNGALQDGQIIINAKDTDKVQLVLNGVNINSSSSAAIYVIEADKVFVTTAEGSHNELSNSGEFIADGDNNIDGVIFSKSDLTMNGLGTLNISTDYGNGIVSKDDLKLTCGTYNIEVSGKGLEANDSIRIADGVYNITSEDDAIHSNDYTTIIGGSFEISSGDDGIHSDGTTTINGGAINIAESYEGIEGQAIYINGGSITLKATDDGLNAAGGKDESGYGNMMDEFAADENAIISISGGTLNIDSEGDGIDSNGNLEISGGEIKVSGPTNSGNGALDYNGTASISGGTIIAVGASGMAENFTEASQGAILVNFSQSFSGEEIKITDTDGNVVLSFIADKSFNSIVVSSPDLKIGESYTISVGDTYQTVTLEDNIYGSGSGMGGMQGGRGGFGGGPRG